MCRFYNFHKLNSENHRRGGSIKLNGYFFFELVDSGLIGIRAVVSQKELLEYGSSFIQLTAC